MFVIRYIEPILSEFLPGMRYQLEVGISNTRTTRFLATLCPLGLPALLIAIYLESHPPLNKAVHVAFSCKKFYDYVLQFSFSPYYYNVSATAARAYILNSRFNKKKV